ncbi:hypothetical protein ACFLRF_01740 [Candidatus Altiarchaeota archaeon]
MISITGMLGMIFLFAGGFYLLFFLAHLLDWSVRTFSGNTQGIIVDIEPVRKEYD